MYKTMHEKQIWHLKQQTATTKFLVQTRHKQNVVWLNIITTPYPPLTWNSGVTAEKK